MTKRNETRNEPLGPPRLAAILFADLASFSRLVSQNELATLEYVQDFLRTFEDKCATFRGEFIKSTGDGVIVLFASARDAVSYAVSMRESVAAKGPDDDTYKFRFGIHLGEVRRQDKDVFGHAVNIAARLEGQAQDGGICVSEAVVAAVGTESRWRFAAMGPRKLKNIEHPMVIYDLLEDPDDHLHPVSAPVHISVVDGFCLRISGRSTPVSLTKDEQIVLCCLALSPTRSVMLGQVSALSQSAEGATSDRDQKGREAMTTAVAALQSKLGAGLIAVDEHIRLSPDLVDVDLAVAEADLLQGKIAPWLLDDRDWMNRLGAGIATGRAAKGWLAAARSDWQDRLARRLERQLHFLEKEDHEAARDLAEALLIAEPGHEQAAVKLMTALHAAGNPGGAARVFDRISRTLRDRYGIEPKRETVAAARNRHPSPITKPPQSDAPLRLLLKPFEGTIDHRIDDFRAELQAGLTSFRGWAVVENPQAPTEAVGSDYFLTARTSSNLETQDVSIALALSEASKGTVLWSERFVLDRNRLDESIRRAIGRIAATLEVYIATDRVGSLDGSVVDTWLRGERLIGRWTPESHDEARQIFEDLTLRAPTFAPGFASLASILNGQHIVRPGIGRDEKLARRAHELSSIAVELDPLDARTRLAAGWAAALDGSFDLAFMNLSVARKLNPHSPRSLISCAMGFSFLGEHDHALAVLATSMEIAPALLDYQWCYAATVYFLAGDDDAALAAAQKSDDRIFDNLGWTAAALSRQGRHAEATAVCSKLIKRMGPIWHGDTAPGPRAVTQWFANAYPIRHDRDRDALTAAINDAMRGLNLPG